MMYRSTLLLNQSYQPIGVVGWHRALNLVLFREKAVIEQEYEEQISKYFNAAVIRLFVKSPDPFRMFDRQKFTKRHLFIRDKYECQYCLKPLKDKELTIDHIVPKSLGGKTSYLNCVVSCKSCNLWKGSKTLTEAGMRLRNIVRKPTIVDIVNSINGPIEWNPYLRIEQGMK